MCDLTGVRLKYERARAHRRTLYRAIQETQRNQPISIEAEIDSNTGDQIWRVHGVPSQPPAELSVFLGDFLYNCRSALDHLAWQLVIAAGKQPSRRTSFPLYLKGKDFEKDGLVRIRGMSDEAIDAIRAFQPCYERNAYRRDMLETLDSLANADKHRRLSTITAALDGALWDPPSGRAEQTYVHHGEISDGTVLARFGVDDLKGRFYPKIGIAITEPGLPSDGSAVDIIYGIESTVGFTINDLVHQFFAGEPGVELPSD